MGASLKERLAYLHGMTTEALKLKIIEAVAASEDESLLRHVAEQLAQVPLQADDAIAGYSVAGTPVTRETLYTELAETAQRMRAGMEGTPLAQVRALLGGA